MGGIFCRKFGNKLRCLSCLFCFLVFGTFLQVVLELFRRGRMLTVADYDRIRRKVKVAGCSQREAAREFGHSRKTVKKALEFSSPPG